MISIFSLSKGSVYISIEDIWLAIFRRGEEINQTIIWDLRLPRLISSLLVGSALGMSGALLQGMLKNGLASPYLLGISAGSGLVIVAFITFGLAQIFIPIAAWLGAIFTTLIVFTLSKSGNKISIERLILGGVAISSLFGAIQATLLLQAEDGRIQSALTWLIGSLNSRGWDEIRITWIPILFSIILSLLLARQLNLLSLGDELSMSLGNSLFRSRCLIGAIATLLAASAVAIGGLIGFIGLIVPHFSRLLIGSDYKFILPLSALIGGLTLSTADLIARSGPIEMPVGIITSLIGAPIFIIILYKRSTKKIGMY
ncbi:FecCD family ABC transporter permease [Prochlorococcus marinus]|uniref:FecCD family ABC transporter permease n=1 Tax=Prochlorococcus marinus TaxID=1219 RepID=UPI00019009B3|nr:iron ABC transporter permease [Prochlorococcus marinus]EEE40478.1 transport system permease protein [Prochlorococcus marinus str. MIT 9202]